MTESSSPETTPPISVYVKWTHQSHMPVFAPEAGGPPLVYHYDVPICPSQPLRIGSHVKLLLLSNALYRPPFCVPEGGLCYDAYEVNIRGPVINVHEATDHVLTLTIRNTVSWSPVQYARISLPYIPKLTVSLDGPIVTRTSRQTSRAIELEHNVQIYDPPHTPLLPPSSPIHSPSAQANAERRRDSNAS